MTFNKHFPDRPQAPAPRFTSVDRALFFRMATWLSTFMLVAGYILIWNFW